MLKPNQLVFVPKPNHVVAIFAWLGVSMCWAGSVLSSRESQWKPWGVLLGLHKCSPNLARLVAWINTGHQCSYTIGGSGQADGKSSQPGAGLMLEDQKACRRKACQGAGWRLTEQRLTEQRLTEQRLTGCDEGWRSVGPTLADSKLSLSKILK